MYVYIYIYVYICMYILIFRYVAGQSDFIT